MNLRDKIISLDDLPTWRRQLRASSKKLVVTNGCFDLLHAGHVSYLEQARNLGDLLLVGLNGDASVRALKGSNRPINPEADRAVVLAALESVNAVCIFPEVRANRFLELAQPDIYVKAGDYTLGTLDPGERQTIERNGGKIVLLPFVAGRSTTALVQKLTRAK